MQVELADFVRPIVEASVRWADLQHRISSAVDAEHGARVLSSADGGRALAQLVRFAVDASSGDDERRFAVRLLPSFHLLLSAKEVDSETRIQISTDHWRSLRWVDDWIDQIIKQSLM